MKQIIVGFGEIGRGLHKVIKGDYYDVHGETSDRVEYSYDVMHICFPYSDTFIQDVEMYEDLWDTKLTIVHSTVPVGTCDSLGVVHSPVRGVHPNIDKGIKTFTKYFGGKGARKASKLFEAHGIKTVVTQFARTTEALKLWDTTQYGVMILLNKYMKKWCDENDADFDLVYTDANKTYNEGYRKLKRDEVMRPYLKYVEGKIGGHCVVPNARLFKSIPSTLIKWFNKI